MGQPISATPGPVDILSTQSCAVYIGVRHYCFEISIFAIVWPPELVERDDRRKSSNFLALFGPLLPHDRNVKIGKRADLFHPDIRLP